MASKCGEIIPPDLILFAAVLLEMVGNGWVGYVAMTVAINTEIVFSQARQAQGLVVVKCSATEGELS